MNFRSVLVIILFLFVSGLLMANDVSQVDIEKRENKIAGFKQSINSCPGGLLFGVYSINYERMLKPKHGLVARFDFENVSAEYSGDKFDATGLAFILNYRRHFRPSLKSCYLGSYLRYKIYDGTGEADQTDFDFDIKEFTIGLNVGKRWVWQSGFNINFMLGYGLAFSSESTTPEDSAIESSFENFKDKYSFDGPMLGEFSIGYAF